MTMARTLHAKIERGVLVSAPGAADALITTRLIEQAGFENVYITGFGGKAAHLGKTDLADSQLRDVCRCRRFTGASSESEPV